MKISQISIKNYRNFEDISINVSKLLILIGENNSGKTNLLRALDIILNPERSYKQVTITSEDFYDVNFPIIIEVKFEDFESEDEDFPPKSHDPDDGFLIIRYTASWNNETDEVDKKCVFHHKDIPEENQVEFYYRIKKHFPLFIIDSERQVNKEIFNKSGSMQKLLNSFLIDVIRSKEIYFEKIKQIWEEIKTRISDISSDIKIEESIIEPIEIIDFLKPKNISQIISNFKNAISLLKTFQKTKKIIIESAEIQEIINLYLKLMDNIKKLEKKLDFNDRVDSLRDYLEKNKGFSEFSKNLKKTFTTIFPQIDFDFSLLPIRQEELLRKVMVNINDFDVFKHGSGLQSNFVICLKILGMVQFMKSEGVKSGFIAIEEPENHIHPHLQRAFISSIQEIKSYYSKLNIQFIITTHSKEIIRYQYPESLAILRLNPKITSISQYSLDYYAEIARKDPEVLVETKDKIKRQKMLKIESQMKRTLKMIFYHYPEIFFAKSVIIVEGYTEEGAFPEFARKMGLNFDIRGVSCINGLGRNSLNQFRLLIEYINIPVVCVYDKDDGSFSPSGKKDTNFITKEKDFEWEIIKNLPASKIITILESNGNKSENDKLLNNLKGIEIKIPRRCDFHGLVKFYEDNPTLNSQTEKSFVNFLGNNKNTAFGYSIGEIIEEGEIPQVYKKAIKKVIKLTK